MKMTKKEIVYQGLKKSINNGDIAPNEKINISEQAKKYNVSEIPVREAINLLASEGLLAFNPGSGVVVVSLTKQDIVEIFELKAEFEALATKMAVNNISNNHIQEIENIIKESTKCLENKDFKGYRQYNRKFHYAIYEHCGNSRLGKIIKNLWEESSRYPMPYATVEQINTSIKEHWKILESLKIRDEKLAEQLVKEHKNRTLNEVLEDLSKYSEDHEDVLF